MRTVTLLLVGAALSLGALAACGDDNQAKCDEIAELCHPVMTTLGQDCHETAEAEDVDTQVCADRYDECIAACAASGTTSSSSTGGG